LGSTTFQTVDQGTQGLLVMATHPHNQWLRCPIPWQDQMVGAPFRSVVVRYVQWSQTITQHSTTHLWPWTWRLCES